MESPDAPAIFADTANNHLTLLQHQHALHLTAADDTQLQATLLAATTIRRAVLLHRAATQIVSIPQTADRPLSKIQLYLQGLLARLELALERPDISALRNLTNVAQTVLDSSLSSAYSVFTPISKEDINPHLPHVRTASRDATYSSPTSMYIDANEHAISPGVYHRNSLRKNLSFFSFYNSTTSTLPDSKPLHACGFSCADLSTSDRIVLWLYVVMVIAAIAAITAITIQFVKQSVNPSSFVRSVENKSLPAPVITVCLSQTGVPFSRLQVFSFVDAEGRKYEGTNPEVPYKDHNITAFKSVVERFWDNPDNEDCDSTVGDYYPFPVQNLNDISAGKRSTKCRQCYRFGSKHKAIVGDTSFGNSSMLVMSTDNYFLQCLKRQDGLDDRTLEYLHREVQEKSESMQQKGILSITNGGNSSKVEDLGEEIIGKLNWKQLCNIFYFAYYPMKVNKLKKASVSYSWNGNEWESSGTGPYFEPSAKPGFLPEESLQMFVSHNTTTERGTLRRNQDMSLIGPNTQTFARLHPLIVYDKPQFDIGCSTTNLRDDKAKDQFGLWLNYKIFYNYNRFVTDEYYRESTYPVSQWLVDLTGYATLFTGASLFSLILIPLLRTMRRREKLRLLRQNPEVYLWSKMRRKYGLGALGDGGGDEEEEGKSSRRKSMLLPGYNV